MNIREYFNQFIWSGSVTREALGAVIGVYQHVTVTKISYLICTQLEYTNVQLEG